MLRLLNVLILLTFLASSTYGQENQRLDTFPKYNKNILKAIGIAWAQVGAFTVGHEFMFSNRLSGEYLYGFSYSVADNGFVYNSYRIGLKYYVRNPQRKFFNNCYGGVYGRYRHKDTWIDQSEIDRIDYKTLGGGISLGRMNYLTKWLTLEMGYNAMLGKENAAEYRYTNVHTHRSVWKILHGPTFIFGISF